jgi:hypothetical protein
MRHEFLQFQQNMHGSSKAIGLRLSLSRAYLGAIPFSISLTANGAAPVSGDNGFYFSFPSTFHRRSLIWCLNVCTTNMKYLRLEMSGKHNSTTGLSGHVYLVSKAGGNEEIERCYSNSLLHGGSIVL